MIERRVSATGILSVTRNKHCELMTSASGPEAAVPLVYHRRVETNKLIMQIRPAREHEAQLLTAIAIEAKAHWGYSPEQIDAWRSQLSVTAERIASSPVYVGEVAGQVAGFYSLTDSSPTWTLDDLWVRPAFMRQGIGRSLLRHAIQLAAKHGASHISIDAEPHAKAFYLSCGAFLESFIPAPIAGDPHRQRPQFVLRTDQFDFRAKS
jgi:ribosomal protein S18 acetylase RimI-like enzyme